MFVTDFAVLTSLLRLRYHTDTKHNNWIRIHNPMSLVPCRLVDRLLVGVCILGVLVSTYALYVEVSAEANPEYVAMCDISEHASCSRVLTSEYARGFGLFPFLSYVPNSVIGILFYCLMIFLSLTEDVLTVRIQFILSILSVAMSVYLAFLLIFVLHDVCVVCISTYIINIGLALLVRHKLNSVISKNK